MNKGNGNEFRKSFFTTVHVLLDSVKSNGNALLVSAYHVNCGALIEFECGNLASVLLSYHFQIQMHLFLESAGGLKGFSLAHESGDTTC